MEENVNIRTEIILLGTYNQIYQFLRDMTLEISIMSFAVHCFPSLCKLSSPNIFMPYRVQLHANLCYSKVQNLNNNKE